MSHPAHPVAEASSSISAIPGEERLPSAPVPTAISSARFLMPREHGAWGMVSLPFIAGALVAGGWGNLRTLAAAFTVVSVFLLRTPLLVLWRSRAAADQYRARAGARSAQDERQRELRDARFSLMVYGSAAAAAGLYLLLSLPFVPLLLLGGGAALLTLATLFLTVRNYQRSPALQITSAIGVTASSLLGYLAARGHLEAVAFWIWALSAAHSSASVLVVHARLESIIGSRKPRRVLSSLPHRRNALLAQAGLWLLLATLAVQGRPWLILPFLPPSFLHGWELWRLGPGKDRRVSMRRVGLMQLGASIAFCLLLITVLR